MEQFKPTKFTTFKKKRYPRSNFNNVRYVVGYAFLWTSGWKYPRYNGNRTHDLQMRSIYIFFLFFLVCFTNSLQLGFCWVKTWINYPSWGEICNNYVCKKKIRLGFRPQDNFAIQKWPIYMYLFNPLNLLGNYIIKLIYTTLIVKFGWRWVCQIFCW